MIPPKRAGPVRDRIKLKVKDVSATRFNRNPQSMVLQGERPCAERRAWVAAPA